MRKTSSLLGRLLLCAVPFTACSDARSPAPSAPTHPTPSVAFAVPRGATPVQAAIALGMTPVAVDGNMPRLLQATTAVAAPGATATEHALHHVNRLAAAWGVTTAPKLESLGEVKVRGGIIVRLRQSIDGLPIDRGEMRVFVRAGSGELVAINGTLVDAATPRNAPVFRQDDARAIALAMEHQYKVAFDPSKLAFQRRRGDGSRVLGGESAGISVQMASARKMWTPQPGGTLAPTWVVESYAAPSTTTNGDAWETRVSADGRVVAHRTIVDDAAFQYRVWADTTGELHPLDGPHVDADPHPTGVPDGSYPAFIPPNLVTVDGLNHPGSANAPPDPWLIAGKTETNGNNVDAYTDLNAPTGLTFGDFRATVTAPGVFDRTYDVTQGPLTSQSQQMAGITSLFYIMNWLHDFWYDHGFTETAGNAQDSNFGRGGEDRDALLAEAQDNANGGSRNNANMSTPTDGLQPRMQVFLWSGKDDHKLTLEPSGRTPSVGTAAFGTQNFDLHDFVLLAQSGTATTACAPLTNAVTGKIVLVDRGTCSFKAKALAVQNAGGIGMILANNNASAAPPGLGDDPTITTPITIGVLSVTQADGNAIKADLAAGQVGGTLHRLVGVELDGTLDSTVVAHEFGHYLHHRLSNCNTKWCGAMSEGWGDFDALMSVVKAGDDLDTAVYPLAIFSTMSFAPDPGYFGIRRAPYSKNQAVNGLAYHHMADGQTLPTNQPFLILGTNSEVHNGGEIWAQTLFDAYVGIQKTSASFDEGRSKMADYVVAGLLMAPVDNTPAEMRDALLLAARAASPADHDTMAAAFAGRGLGSCAVTPARDSQTFVGIVDGNDVRGRAIAGATTLANVTACDSDDILDAGETSKMKIAITNPGHKDITNALVRVASSTPGVSIVSPPIAVASLPAYTSMNAEVEVKLSEGVTGPTDGFFFVDVVTPDGCDAVTTTPVQLRLNVDDVPMHSTTDAFNTATSVWTAGGDAVTGAWVQERETNRPLNGFWHGTEPGIRSDTSIVSPPLTASATDPVTVTFSHRHAFETGSGQNFDGGVVEVSIDGGVTFQDVTALGVASPYNGTITTQSDNPLPGRAAFVGTSAGNPALSQVTLDFANALAGKTFQLRFRIGTDSGGSVSGWVIDDVAVTGITGTPFPEQVGNQGQCQVTPPDGAPDAPVNPMPDAPAGTPDAPGMQGGDDDGGCCDAGPLRTGNVAVSLGVLGILLRRRKR